MSERNRREGIGLVVGVLTFLGGVALLLFTFQLALVLFSTPPSEALQIQEKTPLDPGKIGQSAVVLLSRIAGILMMCIIGSVISNRGIRLYQAAIGDPMPSTRKKKESTPARSEVPKGLDSSE